MKFLSNRLVALGKLLTGEQFRADSRLTINPELGLVLELPGPIDINSNFAAGATISDTFNHRSEILQVGVSAAVNVDSTVLSPGLWRITGHATIAGAIAVGNALWQYGLLDLAAAVPSVFPLASWRTLGGIQVAQNFRIAITLLLSQPWQIRHAAPATAAGDTLAMRVNLLYSRLT